jgi:hypothetical protein
MLSDIAQTLLSNPVETRGYFAIYRFREVSAGELDSNSVTAKIFAVDAESRGQAEIV